MNSKLGIFVLVLCLLAMLCYNLCTRDEQHTVYERAELAPIEQEWRVPELVSKVNERAIPLTVRSETVRSVGTWKNIGNKTPEAAFESLLWAKEHFETATLASLITFSPELHQNSAEIFFSLSPMVRNRLSIYTPDQLIAYVYSISPFLSSFRIEDEREIDNGLVAIKARLTIEEQKPITIDFKFRFESGGWRYVLDERNAHDHLNYWRRVFLDPDKK